MEQLTAGTIINRAIGLREGVGYIDVIALADTFGIDIYPDNDHNHTDDEFHACIEYDKKSDKYKIFVNPDQPLERQRFSIAHELAHFVLHNAKLKEKGILNRNPLDIANKTEDNQADKLAAEILMPQKYVDEFMKKENVSKAIVVTKSIINKIAECFKVSRTVAAIRLRELRYYVPFYSFAA